MFSSCAVQPRSFIRNASARRLSGSLSNPDSVSSRSVPLGVFFRRVRAGEAALIPPWVPHTVRALDQPAYQLDVFSPPRKAMLAMLDALARGE